MTEQILVTGAPGFVGSYVVKELLENHFQVVGLYRKSSSLNQLAHRLNTSAVELQSIPNLSLVEGDITDIESIREAVKGCDYILHIAALFRQAKHPPEVFEQVNIQGTDNVMKIAHEAGIKRVVHCSTVGVHSHIPNPPADEEEAYRPGDIYQETKCEGEKVALKWFRERGLNGVVIRPAMIWGPGDSRTLKLFRGIAKKRFPFIGWGKTDLHWVSVIDLATSFCLAMKAPINSGEVYIIAGDKPISLESLLQKIASVLKVSPPRLRIPALPIQLLGSLCEALCVPFGIEPPLHRRRVDFFTKTRSFSWEKAKEQLGYTPRGSIDDEIREIVAWYEANNWNADYPENKPSSLGALTSPAS